MWPVRDYTSDIPKICEIARKYYRVTLDHEYKIIYLNDKQGEIRILYGLVTFMDDIQQFIISEIISAINCTEYIISNEYVNIYNSSVMLYDEFVLQCSENVIYFCSSDSIRYSLYHKGVEDVYGLETNKVIPHNHAPDNYDSGILYNLRNAPINMKINTNPCCKIEEHDHLMIVNNLDEDDVFKTKFLD